MEVWNEQYACRKTLADNRPRIRGRFARNDEPGEIPKAACSTREEDEDDFWVKKKKKCFFLIVFFFYFTGFSEGIFFGIFPPQLLNS